MKASVKVLLTALSALLIVTGLSSCSAAATTASENLSQAADNFEVMRRIVFINGITDKYLLTIEGKCSIKPDAADSQLEVTCKDGPNDYKKHFLGISDNVSYIVEQLEGADVSEVHSRVFFKPGEIIPNIDLKTEGN